MQTLYQHIQDIYSSVVKRKVETISESKKALNKIAMAFFNTHFNVNEEN